MEILKVLKAIKHEDALQEFVRKVGDRKIRDRMRPRRLWFVAEYSLATGSVILFASVDMPQHTNAWDQQEEST